jgi:hypothetical protein
MMILTSLKGFFTVKPLLMLAEVSENRQLLNQDGNQHSSGGAAQHVALQAEGVLPAIQVSPRPVGGAWHLQMVGQGQVLQGAVVQLPAVQLGL